MRWITSPSPSTPLLPGFHPLVAQVLSRHGIARLEDAHAFLDPSGYTPTSAFTLPGMVAAVERILSAIHKEEQICIWGDFDVDGQTSTALLVQALRRLGGRVTHHVPVRSRESHGVSVQYLQEVIDKGARLIVTCDTGISAHDAAEYAFNRKVDFIITDHHDLPIRLPRAYATINPKTLPAGHPLGSLAGVGVAYKLVEALIEQSTTSLAAEELLDLVALGLVGDLASLQADTRYLVQKGLEVLRRTKRLGLQTMFMLADIQAETINESHIGYAIAPRLNAMGRLADAQLSVELLLTTDPSRARVLATQIENFNAQRKLLARQVTHAADSLLKTDPALLAAPIIIIGNPSWPGGVIGIVASHIVERYGKPAIILTTPPGEPARGSARSVDGLHITEAIAAQSDLLINFGGHPMAAGLSLPQENLPAFYKRMVTTVEKMQGTVVHPEPVLEINGWIAPEEISLELADSIESLSPYGPGNPRLILASRSVKIEKAVPLGRNKDHLRLNVVDETGATLQVMWWDGGSETLPEGLFDLAFTLRASSWRGQRQATAELVAINPIASNAVDVKRSTVEVLDFRSDKDPKSIITSARDLVSAIIWAEGNNKESVGGKDRNELSPADTLIIWSIPPSPQELLAALDIVHPGSVWLIGADPPDEITENFIARLTGLLKFAINHRDGNVSYPQLAAATGHRLVTVERGVHWLVSHGNITLMRQEGDQLWVAPGKTLNDLGGSARLWMEVQSLLVETAAYRAYFRRAEKDQLFS